MSSDEGMEDPKSRIQTALEMLGNLSGWKAELLWEITRYDKRRERNVTVSFHRSEDLACALMRMQHSGEGDTHLSQTLGLTKDDRVFPLNSQSFRIPDEVELRRTVRERILDKLSPEEQALVLRP
jgi:hypothetical protein